jgi:hypothetical protein
MQPFSRISTGYFSCAFLALAGASVSIPAGAAAWSAPKVLTSYTLTNLPVNSASVAVRPNGDSVAVWINEANFKVQYAERKGGVWTAAKTVYTASTTKGEMTASPHVVVEPNGNATVIFASTTPGPLQYCAVGGRVVRCKGPDVSFAKLATLVAGATAWTRANVSAQGIAVSDTQLGVDQSGNAVAAWKYVEKAGVQPALQSASRPAGGAWGTAQTRYTSANAISYPCLAVGAAGDGLLVWQEKTTSSIFPYLIRGTSQAAGAAWGPVEEISAQNTQSWTLRCGNDANGQSAMVWDDGYTALLARRSIQRGWSAPEPLASAPGRYYGPTGPYSAYAPDLAVDNQGDLLVTWLENDVTAGVWTIEAQLHRVDGQIQSTTLPSIQQAVASRPHASLSPDGSLGMVAWVDNGDSMAYSASYTPAGGWAQPLALGAALWDTDVMLGTGPGGNASAIWMTGDVTRYLWKYLGASYLP